MTCQRCKSDRIISINAKCSDTCSAEYKGRLCDGYAPDIESICGGDYVCFNVCAECGSIQGDFPISEERLLDAFPEPESKDEETDNSEAPEFAAGKNWFYGDYPPRTF